jgi:hypothetical protein
VSHNPAGLAKLESTLLQIGNSFSYSQYRFERAPTLDWGNVAGGVPPYVTFTEVENSEPFQLLEPTIGAASSFGLSDFTFALVAGAPAGVSEVQYPVDGGQRYMMVSRETLMLSYSASVAWSAREDFGFGLSVQWLHVPKLRYQLVIDANVFPREVSPVSSELDMLATTEGSDAFTLNAVVGGFYRPVPFLELALCAQVIPSEVRAEGTLSVEPLSPEINEDVVLRRDGFDADDVVLTLPLPITAQLGIRFLHLVAGREVFDIELDLGYTSWSRVERFELHTDGLVASLRGQRLPLGTIPIDKRWRDNLSVRLGGDYSVLPALSLRSGVFYESPVADRSYAHIDFASGAQLGGALGLSVWLFGVELAIAYQYRFQPALNVPEDQARVAQQVPGSQCEPPFDDPDACHPQYLGQQAPAINAGSYLANAHAMSLDVLYRF